MSLTHKILGTADRDNALLVQIDTGQSIERLLFDCGDGCVSELGFADIQAINQLFFSHLHMDHIGGFDSFFRCNYSRDTRTNRIWGPPQTARILQHRFQGFLWNLHEQMNGTWCVCEVHPDAIHTMRYELREAFAVAHDEGSRPCQRIICETDGYSVEALVMEHKTATLAYLVREKPRRNIDTTRMASLGLKPGPWLKQLKESTESPGNVVIGGVAHSLEELRKALVVETPGNSIAYLTDFLLDDSAMDRLSAALKGCRTIVCEGQYRHADLELAQKNYHMTTVLSATLAQRAEVDELVLFHLSDRYERETWVEMLREARAVFPNTHYPLHWNMD